MLLQWQLVWPYVAVAAELGVCRQYDLSSLSSYAAPWAACGNASLLLPLLLCQALTGTTTSMTHHSQ
jgi:hypothetical protein